MGQPHGTTLIDGAKARPRHVRTRSARTRGGGDDYSGEA